MCVRVFVRARAWQAMKAEAARGEGARSELENLRDRSRRLRREARTHTRARAPGLRRQRLLPPPTPNIQDPEGLIFTKAAPSPTEEVTARVTVCLIPI